MFVNPITIARQETDNAFDFANSLFYLICYGTRAYDVITALAHETAKVGFSLQFAPSSVSFSSTRFQSSTWSSVSGVQRTVICSKL